jgi:hypothetical protein
MTLLKLAPSAVQDSPCPAARHSCEVPTTCQPPSAWCKDPWPATIRDISTDGLSLSLNRRFERGSGLAIELPTEDGTTATVLARVVAVGTHPQGGWLLGCRFISELSEEEVQRVLELDPVNQATLSHGEGRANTVLPSINGVLFQGKLRRGEILRWFVKRLDLAGAWPLLPGKVVSLRIGDLPDATPAIELGVRDCRLFGSYWIVDCKLLAMPSDEVLHALATAPQI